MLEGRRLLITGVMTPRSIAFTVAARAQELGADVLLTTFGRARRLTERAARRLPQPVDVLELDANREDDFHTLTEELAERWGRVDGALHSIAFAPQDAMNGDFLATPFESARVAFETSAFSLKRLADALLPLLPREGGGSLVALHFDASAAWPGYDWMGVAKGAMESIARYLARDLGPLGARVNLVASGPLLTVAAGGFDVFAEVREDWARTAPLGWDQHDRGPVADAVCFLFSDMARAITGEILHVDGGFHAIGRQYGLGDREVLRARAEMRSLARAPAPAGGGA